MRCVCCNRNLNDWESTAKSALTGQYLDMCNKCIKETQIDAVGNPDLMKMDNSMQDINYSDYEYPGYFLGEFDE